MFILAHLIDDIMGGKSHCNLLLCDFAESHFKQQGLVTSYHTGNDGEQQLQPYHSKTKQTLKETNQQVFLKDSPRRAITVLESARK